MSSRCAFGGRRVSVLGSDGRIVVKEKDVKDDIATFEPCGATSIQIPCGRGKLVKKPNCQQNCLLVMQKMISYLSYGVAI